MAPTVSDSTDVSGYVYALVLSLGGAYGAARRGSLISLAAGVIGGLAAAYGASRVSKDPRDVVVSIATCYIMGAVMIARFLSNWKFMPSGLIMASAILDPCVLAYRQQVLSLGMAIKYTLSLAT